MSLRSIGSPLGPMLLTLAACSNAAPSTGSTAAGAPSLVQAGAPALGGSSATATASTVAAGAAAPVGASTTAVPQTAAHAQPAASALLARAQTVFQPLPASMDSPLRPVTPEKITLGRQLYYEKRLSKAQTMSCNTCHDLSAYGTDSRAGATGPFSQGHGGKLGGRNSPTSYNAALHLAQFWDGRAADVEAQAKGPILNPVEMALPDEATAVAVIKSIPGYAPLFAAAYPGEADPITFDNMAIAIGAFERRLVTKDRFDDFLRGDPSALTASEQTGLSAFLDSGCAGCHAGAGLGGGMYQKLGLLKPYTTLDNGRFDVTMVEVDRHVFKVPSLRNIEKTAPYFHDGSQLTLTAAVATMAEYQTPSGKLAEATVGSIVTFLASLTGVLPLDYVREPTVLSSSATTPAPNPN